MPIATPAATKRRFVVPESGWICPGPSVTNQARNTNRPTEATNARQIAVRNRSCSWTFSC